MWVTYRLLPCVVEHVRRNINGLALDLVGPAAIVSYAADNRADVSAGHIDGLSVVQRLDGSQQIHVLLGQVGQLQQVDAALLGRDLAPLALESLPCGGNGEVDILLGGLGDGADDLLCGGIDDLEGLLVDALDPLVVDEAGG